MSPFRRKDEPAPTIPSRRPHPGLLRRERRALLKAREDRLRDLGGIVVEMYRRSAFRDDLVHERCAEVMGIDELLHGSDGTERCSSCGAAVLYGSHFCPNCGRLLDEDSALLPDDTVVAAPPDE